MQRIRLHVILLALAWVTVVSAQRYEYWLDGDYGHRTQASYPSGDIINSIDVSTLSPGLHFYNVRTQGENGVWGSVHRYVFTVPGMAGNSEEVRYESWIDGDYIHRTISTHSGGDIVQSTKTGGLLPGIHYYNVRACNKHGVWGPVNRYLFIVPEVTEPAWILYWIDDDTNAAIQQPVSGSSVELTVSVANQGEGKHTFNCQLQDTNGKWSPTYSYDFVIEQQADTQPHEATMAEYFFDKDPGYGKGIPLHSVNSESLHFVLSVEGLKSGAHVLYVRTADKGGKWSGTVSRPLYVRPLASNTIVQLEYFFDSKDPGRGNAIQVKLPEGNDREFTFEVKLEGLALGDHQLNIRAKGSNGLWSVVRTDTFTLIGNAGVDAVKADCEPSVIYSLQGYQTNELHGVNIVRFKDGTRKKIIAHGHP